MELRPRSETDPSKNTWDPLHHWDTDDDIRNPAYVRYRPEDLAQSSTPNSPPASLLQKPDPTWRPDPTSHTPPSEFVYRHPPRPDRTRTDRLPDIPNEQLQIPCALKRYLILSFFRLSLMEEFEPGHQDRVTVIHVNYNGTRVLTASIDHRVKVWDRNPKTYQKTLIDTWVAHDADIRDAKWFHTTTGQHIATIGNDLRCRIWSEDPSQPPNSGRRFKRVHQISSTAKIPFVSLDLKTINSIETYLALIDRQGLLTVYEPTSIDSFGEWSIVDQWEVIQPAPGRGEETSFRVRFDPNYYPLPYINHLPCEKKMLSLVVTAMNYVKIYRTVRGDSNGSSSAVESSRPFTFWEACQFDVQPNLVRDVQWATGNVRGHDLFATACKDGSVRIYELAVSPKNDAGHVGGPESSRKQSQTSQSQPRSTLTTAIVGRQAMSMDPASSNSNSAVYASNRVNTSRQGYDFPWKQELTLATKLEGAHNDAWMVSWDPTGKVVMSGGADGVTKLWKKGIFQEEWKLFADHAVQIGEEDSPEDENGKENGDG